MFKKFKISLNMYTFMYAFIQSCEASLPLEKVPFVFVAVELNIIITSSSFFLP